MVQARGNQAAIQQRIDGNDRRVYLFDICDQEIADEFIRRRGLLLAEMFRANDRILFAVENFGREIKVAGALVERQQNNVFHGSLLLRADDLPRTCVDVLQLHVRTAADVQATVLRHFKIDPAGCEVKHIALERQVLRRLTGEVNVSELIFSAPIYSV